jgi:acetyl esterase/lipase
VRRGALLVLVLLAGCAGEAVLDAGSALTTSSPNSPSSSIPSSGEATTSEYLPGVEATVLLPADVRAAPLVVLVPGGAWLTADPTGFQGLARYLADAGVAAAPVEVRAAEDGVLYPTPIEDVICAAAFAADTARADGIEPDPVVVLGHSSGAHLAALAVLTWGEHTPACAQHLVTPDALIGMAGTYDVSILPDLALPLFGVSPEQDSELWESGNPVSQASLRPEVPALLIHGDADDLVPVSFTTSMADALESAGHPVTVELVSGADHHQVYSAESSGHLITTWVRQLARPAG